MRELQNICERAAVLTPGGTIEAGLLDAWLRIPAGSAPGGAAPPAPTIDATELTTLPADAERALPSVSIEPKPAGSEIVCDGVTTLDEIERHVIVATLQHYRGHRQKSAKALGIGVRTLGLKLKKWKEQQLVAQGL